MVRQAAAYVLTPSPLAPDIWRRRVIFAGGTEAFRQVIPLRIADSPIPVPAHLLPIHRVIHPMLLFPLFKRRFYPVAFPATTNYP
eukprot:2964106-Rhodomonas_salina.1